MEKRLFVFVVLSIVVWGGYLGLQFYFAPPKPLPKLADTNKIDNKQAENKAAAEKRKLEKEKKSAEAESPDDEAATSQVARQRVTLGSLDPTSGYTLLVTLDNRGAAIERIEFNDRYHDLDDRTGYLGHLAATDAASGGAEVNVVGPGTPAAEAISSTGTRGLQAGDVIVSIDQQPIRKARDLTEFLEQNTKPKQEIELVVQRGTNPSATHTYQALLTRRPLELIRPEDNSGATAVDLANPGDFNPKFGPPSFRATLLRVGDAEIGAYEEEIAKLPSLHHANWNVQANAQTDEVTFTTDLSSEQLADIKEDSSLQLTKTYRLVTKTEQNATKAYHLNFDIAVKNIGDEPQTVAYRLEGPNGLPLEGWWYSNKVHPGWAGAGARDIRYYSTYRQTHELLGNPLLTSEAATQVKAENPARHDLLGATDKREFGYLAVDAQYFASALLPGDVLTDDGGKMNLFNVDAAYALALNKIKDAKWAKTTNVSFFIDSTAKKLAPGEEFTDSYVIFAGPKDPDVLTHYQLNELIEYGWFGWVVKVLKAVLHLIYMVVKNYGIAIILLTVIVRLCLLPFSIRQAKSAAVMQAMAPELAKLKEKYPNDLEKQSTAQRELFAKHGVNPMGGCLLMFAQLPIFIGLYRCLATDIDLREAALIPGVHWASNLAAPDELFRWKQYLWRDLGDEAHGWLGPYCNILPLITIVLFMVQQKLFTPPAITEEQKTQQKIMNFMTLFMGVMFYKVPAGLCIYFITSSLWGICERKMLPKPKPGSTAVTTSVPEKPAPSDPTTNKKPAAAPSWMDKVLGMADAQLKESKTIAPRKKTKK